MIWQYVINKKAYRTKESGLEINSGQTIFSLHGLYRHVRNWSIKESKCVTHKMTGFKNWMYYSNMHVSVCTHGLQRNCNNQSENWDSVKSEGWKPQANSQKPGYCSTCHRDTQDPKPRAV